MKYRIDFVVLFLAAACTQAPQPTTQPSTQPGSQPSTQTPIATTSPDTSVPAETALQTQEAPVVQRPVWQTLPLTNARTGETFTLADFEGRAVFVEPMATWCSNCRSQLNNLKTAKDQVDGDVVLIALSVETNLTAADLAAYADDEGFDWIFAVATPELLTALSAQFGRTIANPPATPHFFIYPDGTFSELHAGQIESVDAIVQALTEADRS